MDEDKTENFEEKIECVKRDEKAFYLCESTIEIIKNVSGKSDTVDGINWLINAAGENERLNNKYSKMEAIAVSKVDLINEYKEANAILLEERNSLRGELKGLHAATARATDENAKFKEANTGLAEEIVNSSKANCELRKENNELKRIVNITGAESLRTENEELKESLRLITSTDKEEPCEQVEKLLWDIQELTAKNRKLEDEIKELNSSKELLQCTIKNFMGSVAQLNYNVETMQSNIDFERGQKVQANKTIKELLEALK